MLDVLICDAGLMSFEELRKRILATSGKTRQDVSEDDMARAIKKLRVLGGGFAVIPIGKHRLVQSVPGELNMDHTAVLQKAEVGVAQSSHDHCATSLSFPTVAGEGLHQYRRADKRPRLDRDKSQKHSGKEIASASNS